MCSVMYRVDVYQSRGDMCPTRTEVMDSATAHRVAEHCICQGASRVNVVALDSSGPWVVATLYPASVPSLHTRASKD